MCLKAIFVEWIMLYKWAWMWCMLRGTRSYFQFFSKKWDDNIGKGDHFLFSYCAKGGNITNVEF